MHLSKLLNRKKLFFLMKLFGAVIILYMGVSFRVPETGERLSDFLDKDFLEHEIVDVVAGTGDLVEQYIDEAMQELNTEEAHDAANIQDIYIRRFDNICKSNTELCKKIEFEGSYTNKEKYLYLSAIYGVVRFLDRSMIVGESVTDTLYSITVDSSIGTRRGYATKNRVVFNLGSVKSRTEFIGLVSHELGHVVDLGSIEGNSRNMHGSFTEFNRRVFAVDDISIDYYSISWKSEKVRKAGTSAKDFCSGYGMSNPFEDFAECFNLYINHNALFKEIAKKNVNLKYKYNFIANILDGKYMSSSVGDLVYVKNNINWRPWDTTRIGR